MAEINREKILFYFEPYIKITYETYGMSLAGILRTYGMTSSPSSQWPADALHLLPVRQQCNPSLQHTACMREHGKERNTKYEKTPIFQFSIQ